MGQRTTGWAWPTADHSTLRRFSQDESAATVAGSSATPVTSDLTLAPGVSTSLTVMGLSRMGPGGRNKNDIDMSNEGDSERMRLQYLLPSSSTVGSSLSLAKSIVGRTLFRNSRSSHALETQ